MTHYYNYYISGHYDLESLVKKVPVTVLEGKVRILVNEDGVYCLEITNPTTNMMHTLHLNDAYTIRWLNEVCDYKLFTTKAELQLGVYNNANRRQSMPGLDDTDGQSGTGRE